MSDQQKPRVPRRSPSSQSIPAAPSMPVAQARGTQQTRLRADGRSIVSAFKGKLDEHILEAAATTAVGFLKGTDLLWIMDFLQVPSFEGNAHQTLSKTLESFKAGGGVRILVAIPETMERYRILRSSFASAGLLRRVNMHHAATAEELAKFTVEQLKR